MNMIEKVARAIYADCFTDEHVDADEMSMEYCRSYARAALEAMKEPTPHMIDAGYSPEYSSSQEVWESMLTAALNEGDTA